MKRENIGTAVQKVRCMSGLRGDVFIHNTVGILMPKEMCAYNFKVHNQIRLIEQHWEQRYRNQL